MSRALSQRASQNPSRPASKATEMRLILCPAFSASWLDQADRAGLCHIFSDPRCLFSRYPSLHDTLIQQASFIGISVARTGQRLRMVPAG
jgi:hypothetical protein